MIKKNKNILGEPVGNQLLVNVVLNRIKDALLNEELKPGDYLSSESEIAATLNVGKTSVREALKMLQSLGVIDIQRGKKTRIRKHISYNVIDPIIFQLLLEEKKVLDILELRSVFEPSYTLLAMKKATSEDIKNIESCIISFERKINKGCQTAEDDLAFHLAILRSTHNPLVIKVGEVILQLFRKSIAKSMTTIPEIALKDHKRIFEAFRSNNKKRLYKGVLESFKGWEKSLKNKTSDHKIQLNIKK